MVRKMEKVHQNYCPSSAIIILNNVPIDFFQIYGAWCQY